MTLRADLVRRGLVEEMVAEGLVEKTETLDILLDGRTYMVEVKVFEVTDEDDKPQASKPVMLTTPAPLFPPKRARDLLAGDEVEPMSDED